MITAPQNQIVQSYNDTAALPKGSDKPRVLLVDDNHSSRFLVTAQLEILGYEHDMAANGFEALELFYNGAYDMVMMDLQMPKLDGLETTKRMRMIERTRNLRRTPIVAVTGRDSDLDRQRCAEGGMQDYLLKPYSMEDLNALLEKHIQSEKEDGLAH
jgi:CheY-like chemotaxis protein